MPPRIKIQQTSKTQIIMLNHNTQLLNYHIKQSQTTYDTTAVIAKIVQHPQKPNIWGLKNLSSEQWTMTDKNNQLKTINPDQSITLAMGTKINFGQTEGQISL
jgi:hypothetical protein